MNQMLQTIPIVILKKTVLIKNGKIMRQDRKLIIIPLFILFVSCKESRNSTRLQSIRKLFNGQDTFIYMRYNTNKKINAVCYENKILIIDCFNNDTLIYNYVRKSNKGIVCYSNNQNRETIFLCYEAYKKHSFIELGLLTNLGIVAG